MKILAPFSRETEVLPLAEAGASELYCGVTEKPWQKAYTYVSNVNLRHDSAANLGSFQQFKEAVQAADSMNAVVFLTLNAIFYSKKQMPFVLSYVEKAVKAGADSLVVSDTALIPKIKREFEVKIVLSTSNPVFNNEGLGFFKEIGVNRVVLPRHLLAEEIGLLSGHAKKMGLETECFVLNETCPNIGGLCTFQHIVEKNAFMPVQPLACRMPYSVKAIGPGKKKLFAENHARVWNNAAIRDCGLCILPNLKRFGVDSVKIAGRGFPLEKKLADVKAVGKAIGLLKSGGGSSGFRKECKALYFDLFHNKCDFVNCYFAGDFFLEA